MRSLGLCSHPLRSGTVSLLIMLAVSGGHANYSNPLYLHCLCQNLTERICTGRGCCFSGTQGCFHYFPSKHQYLVDENTNNNNDNNDNNANLARGQYSLTRMASTSAHGFSIVRQISFAIVYRTANRLELTFWNPENYRPAVNYIILYCVCMTLPLSEHRISFHRNRCPRRRTHRKPQFMNTTSHGQFSM